MNEMALRKVNIGLLCLIVLINLYTIALPFLPGISYWWRARNNPAVTQSVTAYVHAKQAAPKAADVCTGNCLIIPRMLLDTPILDGPERNSFNLLKAGVWRLPFSTTPKQAGNMVLAAHRFSYTGPRGLFYYLDKLRPGDEIGIRWEGTLYQYKVEGSRVVPPTEVSVEQPTSDSRLTMYTCTPLFNPVNRLVVVAKPMSQEVAP